jgi:sodium bicarbonate transporter 10
LKKIPAGAEASNVLVGEVDCLEKPVSAFIRLVQPVVLGDLTEVPVPTRFIFILLGPVVSDEDFLTRFYFAAFILLFFFPILTLV